MSPTLPLPKTKQLELMLTFTNPEFPELKAAINQYLSGDWNRRAELFDLTPEEFVLWADQQENLAKYRINLSRGQRDGLYLVEVALKHQLWNTLSRLFLQVIKSDSPESRQRPSAKWQVYWQERGAPADSVMEFENFNRARRYALAQRLEEFLGFNAMRKTGFPGPKINT